MTRKEFYNSKEWKRTARAYLQSQHYVCERCGRPAVICHHKKYLNDRNYTDPAVSLCFDNLEALCQDCHNKEHSLKRPLVKFDDEGNVTGCKESKDQRDFRLEREAMEKLFKRVNSLQALSERLRRSL